MEHFYFESNGKGRIHWVLWEPKDRPLAVLQIVHGVAEYIERYSPLAEYLTERGIAVAGEDHMGHGRSIDADAAKGCFYGGWNAVAADCQKLHCLLQERYPGVPMFLLGHSMGSFLVRTMLFLYPDSGVSGVMVSGTGWQPKPMLSVGTALCNIDCRRNGQEHVSAFINNLAFGGYNKAFSPNRTTHDWLCTDESEVDKYVEDPLCGFDVTSGLARDMMNGLKMIEDSHNLEKMEKSLPVWFYSGKEDPVGDMTKGVMKSVNAFKKAGMKNVTVSFYEGRHEIHNEPWKETLYQDIAANIHNICSR